MCVYEIPSPGAPSAKKQAVTQPGTGEPVPHVAEPAAEPPKAPETRLFLCDAVAMLGPRMPS